MKVKTSELAGPALDWAVAMAIGAQIYIADKWWVNGKHVQKLKLSEYTYWGPSTNWAQCGPLIEKYMVMFDLFDRHAPNEWLASIRADGKFASSNGSNHLIAACRAIVASQLGEEVDVPDVLCPM